MFKADKGGRRRLARGHGRHGARLQQELQRGPGRRRAFEYGQLRYLMLQLLADKPSHGYEIIKAIEERTAGAYVPSPGVVYPTLALLEDMECIASGGSDENRKLYKITATGRKFLADNRAAVDEVNLRLGRAAALRGQVEAPQIVRAMYNLKTALRLKVGSGGLSAAQLQAIAAALDAAATQIEQL